MPRLLLPLLLLLSYTTYAQSDSVALAAILNDYDSINETLTPWQLTTPRSAAREIADLTALRSRLSPLTDLSPQQKIDRDLLDFVLDDRLFLLDFGHYLFPLDAEGGFLAGIVYRFSNSRVADEVDYARLSERLRTLPEYLAGQQQNMREGMARGKVNPRRVVELNLALIDRQLETPVEESLFVLPVAGTEWRDSIVQLTRDSVYPAYTSLRQFLTEEYLPVLPQGIGISGITDGKEFYRQRVRFFTSDSTATPEEVFATGQREVARIRSEMDSIIGTTGFDGSFSDFVLHLRTAAQFYAETPEQLLERAAWITKRMEGKIPRYFNKLPRMPLTVSPVPTALAPNYTGGRYSSGSYEDRRAGAFWVNTYDLPSRPLYTLPALALHEGVPGHHTQMMLAAELEEMSDFRRGLYLSAFGEGWGLYAEYLGEEAGMYTDAYEQFGRLTYEMWRACRLVVDPGMHYFGWSRDEAVAFMSENTALSLREVNSEIDRYIGWPGQAVSYKMGELRIRQLRSEAEAALGARFDLADFHDIVLGNGSVTMSLLAAEVRRYVADRLKD
jgi:uncharacterized protein (DUF885 family)